MVHGTEFDLTIAQIKSKIGMISNPLGYTILLQHDNTSRKESCLSKQNDLALRALVKPNFLTKYVHQNNGLGSTVNFT